MIYILLTLFIINIPEIYTQKHDIIIERVEKLYIDNKYADFNVSMRKINRHDTGLTVFVDVYKNIYSIAYVSLQLYALFSNEYKLMPLQISRHACAFMDSEWQWVADEVVKTGNIPRKCPIPPGLYYVKDYILDSRKIPEMPWDQMMVWGNVSLALEKEKIVIAMVKIYVRYDRDGMFLRKMGIGG